MFSSFLTIKELTFSNKFLPVLEGGWGRNDFLLDASAPIPVVVVVVDVVVAQAVVVVEVVVEGGGEVGIDDVVRSITLLFSSMDANEKDVRIRLGGRLEGAPSHSSTLFLEAVAVGKWNVEGDVLVERIGRGVACEGLMEDVVCSENLSHVLALDSVTKVDVTRPKAADDKVFIDWAQVTAILRPTQQADFATLETMCERGGELLIPTSDFTGFFFLSPCLDSSIVFVFVFVLEEESRTLTFSEEPEVRVFSLSVG